MSVKAVPAPERFWPKVTQDGECWVWLAAKKKGGYGVFQLGRGVGVVRAHRWAYEQMVGPIPEGLTLDHLCRRPACVNPDHLDPVPLAVNNARQGAANTTCRSGAHPKVAGSRQCRECARSAARAAYRRRTP